MGTIQVPFETVNLAVKTFYMRMHEPTCEAVSYINFIQVFYTTFIKFTFAHGGGGSTSSDPTFTSRPPTAGSGGAL